MCSVLLFLALALTAGACSTPPHDEPVMSDSSSSLAEQADDEPPAKRI